MFRRISSQSAAAVALVSLVAALLFVSAAPAAADSASNAADEAFVEELNRLRTAHGVSELQVISTMAASARSWSFEMADDQWLRHAANISDGAPDDWRKAGENVGRGYSVSGLMTAFMSSPAHAANALDPAFTVVGVGTVVDEGGQLWTTHRFAASASGAAAGTGGGTVRTCFGETATIVAEPGVKTVGTSGRDVIFGTSGPDVIVGRGGNDLICGFGGPDRIKGGPGKDRIKGGAGRDTLLGGRGRDRLYGGRADDRIYGEGKADRIKGGSGSDILRGGRGPDTLWGKRGVDSLEGGKGRDTLHLR